MDEVSRTCKQSVKEFVLHHRECLDQHRCSAEAQPLAGFHGEQQSEGLWTLPNLRKPLTLKHKYHATMKSFWLSKNMSRQLTWILQISYKFIVNAFFLYMN